MNNNLLKEQIAKALGVTVEELDAYTPSEVQELQAVLVFEGL